jgi:hypothetical protein
MILLSGGKKRIAPSHNLFFPMNGRKALVTLFLLLLIPVYWIELNTPAVGYYHDDGIYVVTAKALAEGKGYRILSLPGEMVQTKYPILFPALLAIVWKICPRFPENAIFLKMVPLIGTFFWVWMLHWFFKEKDKNDHSSTGIILITLASPWIVFFSVTVLSETFFALFCTGALIFLYRLEENTGDKEGRVLFFASVFSAAAFLTRTAGLPLIIAGTVSLFLRRKYRSGLLFFFLCAVIVLPWILWQIIFHTENSGTYAYYSSSSYRNWNLLAHYTLEQKSIVLATNFLWLVISPIRLLALGYVNLYLDYILSIAATGFFIIGFRTDLRKGVKSIHLFLTLYYGMLLVWLWVPVRFIIPIFPFWLYFTYIGFKQILGIGSIKDRTFAIVNRGFILILCLILGIGLYTSSLQTLHNQKASIAYIGEKTSDDWMEFHSLLDWVRENTPNDSVLIGMLDPAIYLYTGRKAVRGFVANPYLLSYSDNSEESLGNVSDLLRYLLAQKVNYIIRTPSEVFRESPIYNLLLAKFISRYKGTVHLVKKGVDPEYQIYRVDQDKLQQMQLKN